MSGERALPTAGRTRPAVSDDTEFFWAGTANGELMCQRCSSCGLLRHPPGSHLDLRALPLQREELRPLLYDPRFQGGQDGNEGLVLGLE